MPFWLQQILSQGSLSAKAPSDMSIRGAVESEGGTRLGMVIKESPESHVFITVTKRNWCWGDSPWLMVQRKQSIMEGKAWWQQLFKAVGVRTCLHLGTSGCREKGMHSAVSFF